VVAAIVASLEGAIAVVLHRKVAGTQTDKALSDAAKAKLQKQVDEQKKKLADLIAKAGNK